MDAHDRDRVPEESVEPILARAAELDRSKRETVSVDVLRSAALEAGISVDAVDRAVEEYKAGVDAPAPRQAAGPLAPDVDQTVTRRKVTGALAIAALAASGAAVAAHAHTPGIALAAVGAGLLAALAVRSFRRRPPSE